MAGAPGKRPTSRDGHQFPSDGCLSENHRGRVGSQWTKDAGKSILFATQKYAGIVAKGIAKKRGYASYYLGAAPREMSAAQIAAKCGGKV